MSEITTAIKARQTQIARLKSEIETLQRAAGLMGGRTKAPAKATKATGKPKAKPQPKSKPKATAKSKTKPQPKPKAKKRHQWTAAEKAAIGKRMKAFWAKRRKPTAATTTPAQPKATQKRTRKPWSAAAKKAMSRRTKASWAKRRKAKG